MTKAPTTHIEVTASNGGAHLGLESGHLLQVQKETNCFFFVMSHTGRKLKVSKHTKRLCHWANAKTSPTFNI
jgi:hypothetical protein